MKTVYCGIPDHARLPKSTFSCPPSKSRPPATRTRPGPTAPPRAPRPGVNASCCASGSRCERGRSKAVRAGWCFRLGVLKLFGAREPLRPGYLRYTSLSAFRLVEHVSLSKYTPLAAVFQRSSHSHMCCCLQTVCAVSKIGLHADPPGDENYVMRMVWRCGQPKYTLSFRGEKIFQGPSYNYNGD